MPNTPSHPQPTCSNCPYWVHIDGGEGLDDEGECHEGPPTLVATAPGGLFAPFQAAWPPTAGSEGCGRHPGYPAWIAWRAVRAGEA